MKLFLTKLFVLLLFVDVSFCHAQKVGKIPFRSLVSSDKEKLRKYSDSLAGIAGNYHFKEDNWEESFSNSVHIDYENDSAKVLRFAFSKKMVGMNTALDIPGTAYYYFRGIYGPYRDLFKIWQLMDPKADLVKASKSINSIGGSTWETRKATKKNPLGNYNSDMIQFESGFGFGKDWNILFLISTTIDRIIDPESK